nr:RNA polymerase alpha subunit [Uronema sp. CCAP 334/1]
MLINKTLILQSKTELISNPIIVSCRESVMEHKTSFYGRFYIGPLELGQGLTLANALRRCLLSELSGVAITSVEIEGVSHEYSTLIGVRESVLDILLNLKQVVLKSKKSLKRPQTAYIYCQGPGVVRAGDILLPSTIACVDPEQYIATLSSDGILKMKLVIRQGKNYLVQTPVSIDSNNSSTSLVLEKQEKSLTFFSGFQKKGKNIKRLQKKSKMQLQHLKTLDGRKERSFPPKKLLGRKEFTQFHHDNLFLSNLNHFVARSAVINGSQEYKVFLKNLYSKEKVNIGKFGSEKNKMLVLKNKKVCLFSVKNYRSLNKIFENSKNKNWFINLFKKQILYILAIKLSKMNVHSSIKTIRNESQFTKKMNTFSKSKTSFDNSGLISNLIKVVKYLEDYPGTYCSNFKSFFLTKNWVNFYNLFSSLNNKVSYTKTTKPLFIDAVFMPVLKVNYILEESKQKVFNDIYFNINNQFYTNDLSNFEQNVMKSVSLEQIENKKTLKTDFLQIQANKPISSTSLDIPSKDLFFGSNYWSLFCLDLTSKNIENFYSEDLFNQFNQSPKDIIVLEIWTNGSILPRTALKLATKNLTNLLIKVQHAKVMKNSFFENKKTYTKTIQKLYEKYQYPNFQ